MSIFIRTYFNFLDQQFGRGVFLVWLSMMLLERKTSLEILFCIIVLLIASIDLILGYGDAKKTLASLPWEAPSMPGAGGGGQKSQPEAPDNGSNKNTIAYNANTDSYAVNLNGE